MPHVQTNGQGGPAYLPSNSFSESSLVHPSHSSHPGYDAEYYERSSYIEGPSIGTHHAPSYSQGHLGLTEMCPTPQGTSRRSSDFNSPSDYESPPTPVPYPYWSTSNPQSHPSTYGFQPQPPSVQVFSGQMTRGPSYATSTVGVIPPPTADVHHGDIFAPGIVSSGVMPHQSTYPNYEIQGTSSVGAKGKTDEGRNPLIPQ